MPGGSLHCTLGMMINLTSQGHRKDEWDDWGLTHHDDGYTVVAFIFFCSAQPTCLDPVLILASLGA